MRRFNTWYLGGFCLIAAGIALVAYDVLRGDAQAGVVLIIPYVIGGGIYSFLGVLCIIGAFFVFFIGMAKGGRFEEIGWDDDDVYYEDVIDGNTGGAKAVGDAPGAGRKGAVRPEGGGAAAGRRTRSKYGGVLLIGPFPVIFGSDRRTALIAAALAITFLVIMFILFIYIMRS